MGRQPGLGEPRCSPRGLQMTIDVRGDGQRAKQHARLYEVAHRRGTGMFLQFITTEPTN